MLIGGFIPFTKLLISSSAVGVGILIDGSQNAVWSLALEDQFHRIMKVAVMGSGARSC